MVEPLPEEPQEWGTAPLLLWFPLLRVSFDEGEAFHSMAWLYSIPRSTPSTLYTKEDEKKIE